MNRALPAPAVAVAELVGATAVSEVDSFADFYRRSRDRIARALALTLGDPHLGAEAADEAMARAFQRWATVSHYSDPAGWVYRVGCNWATSVLRRRLRAPRPPADRPHDIPAIGEPDVLAALQELDVKHRSVVVCRFYLGYSEAETAAALDINPGTAKSRLHRAMRRLQTRLAHLNPQELQ